MSNAPQFLKLALEENQFVVTDKIQQQFLHYLELLKNWNRVFNLTRITTMPDMIYLHIIDSLSVLPFLQGKRYLDVGSGAGLPGIPLAIMNSQQSWVLLDKSAKKTKFLFQVVAELQLPNVEVIHNLCENFHPDYCFDTILSRALGTLRMFIELTDHLLCPAGQLLAMKGKYPAKECHDIPKEFAVQNITRCAIKGINIERHVVCIKRKTIKRFNLWEK